MLQPGRQFQTERHPPWGSRASNRPRKHMRGALGTPPSTARPRFNAARVTTGVHPSGRPFPRSHSRLRACRAAQDEWWAARSTAPSTRREGIANIDMHEEVQRAMAEMRGSPGTPPTLPAPAHPSPALHCAHACDSASVPSTRHAPTSTGSPVLLPLPRLRGAGLICVGGGGGLTAETSHDPDHPPRRERRTAAEVRRPARPHASTRR